MLDDDGYWEDDDEDFDDVRCEWCDGDPMECWCEEGMNCVCGAFAEGENGYVHIADCFCGA